MRRSDRGNLCRRDRQETQRQTEQLAVEVAARVQPIEVLLEGVRRLINGCVGELAQ